MKFSYAITCHKSQGGQWKNVFVEQPYLPNGVDKDYLRWLYTAITRAQERLYLIGFKEDFSNKMSNGKHQCELIRIFVVPTQHH